MEGLVAQGLVKWFKSRKVVDNVSLDIHHIERRRLPGTVRAQQTDDLSTLDVERHVVDDLAALEPLHQPLRDEPFHPSDPSRQLLHDSPGLRPCPFCLPSSRGEKTALTRSCLPPWTTARSSESSIVMVSPLTTLSFCQTRASPMRTTRCSRSKYSARVAVAVRQSRVMMRTAPVETVRTTRSPFSARYTSIRSAYWIVVFGRATPLPVKLTRLSFP